MPRAGYSSGMVGHPGMPVQGTISLERLLGFLSQTMGKLDQAAAHFEEAFNFCRAGYRVRGLVLLRLRRLAPGAERGRRPDEGRVPAGRGSGHLQ